MVYLDLDNVGLSNKSSSKSPVGLSFDQQNGLDSPGFSLEYWDNNFSGGQTQAVGCKAGGFCGQAVGFGGQAGVFGGGQFGAFGGQAGVFGEGQSCDFGGQTYTFGGVANGSQQFCACSQQMGEYSPSSSSLNSNSSPSQMNYSPIRNEVIPPRRESTNSESSNNSISLSGQGKSKGARRKSGPRGNQMPEMKEIHSLTSKNKKLKEHLFALEKQKNNLFSQVSKLIL